VNLAVDLDGTLLTCEPRQMACLRAALNRYGQKADLSGVWRSKRDGATTQQALLSQGIPAGVAGMVSDFWAARVEDPFWLSFDRVLPSVADSLGDVVDAGAKIFVLTARRCPHWVRPQLSALKLDHCLERLHIVSPERAAPQKAAILTGRKIDHFIGDTESDWRAAQGALVPFTAVCSGQRSPEFLRKCGVDAVANDFREAVNGLAFKPWRAVR